MSRHKIMQSLEQLNASKAEVERNLKRSSREACRLAREAQEAYHNGLMGDICLEPGDPWTLNDGRLATDARDDVLAWQEEDFARAADLLDRALFGTGFDSDFRAMLQLRDEFSRYREAFFSDYTTMRPVLSDPIGMRSGLCISEIEHRLRYVIRDDRVHHAPAARELLGLINRWLREHTGPDGSIIYPRSLGGSD